MPEFRQNLATKDWVVVAAERAVKPQSLRRTDTPPSPPEKDAACPFCAGGAAARSEAHKTPVLVAGAPKVDGDHGTLYRRLPGEGVHETIVESARHGRRWSDFTPEEARAAVDLYRERFRSAADNLKVALTLLFKNEGLGAVGQIMHPTAQLVGSSVVPAHVRHRMDEAQKHYEQHNECVFCRMIEEELAQKKRVIAENEHFVAFVLFAALSPFHIWVLPRRHTPGFHEMTDAEAASLAQILRTVTRKIDGSLNKPDFSWVLQSTPQDRGTTEAFHWYLSLVVRSGQAGGFELGSGMFLNGVVPEEAARFLQAAGA